MEIRQVQLTSTDTDLKVESSAVKGKLYTYTKPNNLK